MANNFLIDGAQSAGTIAQNIFNGATKDNSLLNKNFLSQGMMLGEGFLGLDFGQIETPEMKEYLKELSINRIKENGNLQGNQLGYSDYDDKAPWSRPDSLKTSTGFTSPNAAIQNTLGASGFRVPETGGKVSFDSSGTNYDILQQQLRLPNSSHAQVPNGRLWCHRRGGHIDCFPSLTPHHPL